jgi:hypothetical protein
MPMKIDFLRKWEKSASQTNQLQVVFSARELNPCTQLHNLFEKVVQIVEQEHLVVADFEMSSLS